MVTEIKLDNLSNMNYMKIKSEVPKSTPPQKNDDIAISEHLSSMVNLLAEEASENDHRIAAVKSRIEANDYQIDFDKLADKIVHHLPPTMDD